MKDRERIQTKASSIPTNAFNQAETGLFRKRPFAVQAETETDTDAHPLPDLQTQLERGARFNESLSRMKVYGNRPVIQPKIAVGPPGDRYEQEADQVADQVMNMKTPTANPQSVQRQEEEQAEESVQMQSLAASITPLVQREAMPEEQEEQVQAKAIQREASLEEEPEEQVQPKTIQPEEQQEPLQTKPSVQRAGQEGEFQADPSIESRLASQKGGGSPLSDEVRSFMEPRIGADFSQVRVHTDGEAVQMNQELNAQAFTHGSDIYFGAGKYNPGSSDGKRLLAHELTHVVQQTGAVQYKLTSSPQGYIHEQEAELMANQVMSAPMSHQLSQNASALSRQPISQLSTPSIQASFISFVLKMGAKKATKGILKNFIKTKIKERVKKYLNSKVGKQFLEEADQIMGVLEDPWWVTAIGFIPIVGDAFDLARLPRQIRTAIRNADALEEKVKLILRRQWELKRTLTIAPPHKVVNALKSFSGKSYKFGSEGLELNKERMKHFLERHHPDFWDGSVKPGQSFFNPKMNIDDITEAIEAVLQQNRSKLSKPGLSNMQEQIEGIHNGVKYVLGLNRGKIGQFYPVN